MHLGSPILTHCTSVEAHSMLCVTAGYGKARKLWDLIRVVHTVMSLCFLLRKFYLKKTKNFYDELMKLDFISNRGP